MRFGPYLATALEKAGLTQSAFAAQVGYAQQNINHVVKGRRAPPLKHLESWAAILGKHIDRELFLDLAHLEHSTPRVQKLVAELREQVRKPATRR